MKKLFVIALLVLSACEPVVSPAQAQHTTVSMCLKWHWKKGKYRYGLTPCIGTRLPDGGFED